jgi:hypothetical protein
LKTGNKSDNKFGITSTVYTALPDTLDEFINMFIDKQTGNVMNIEKFKRRIIGLTSYFRSAQEELLPRYNKNFDRHVVYVPMSDYQFNKYEEYRHEERNSENVKKTKGAVDKDGTFKEPSSTYRIFSRLACNFVMPSPPGRPIPKNFRKKDTIQVVYGPDGEIKKGDVEQKVSDKIPAPIPAINKKEIERAQKAEAETKKELEKEKKVLQKAEEKAAKERVKEQERVEKERVKEQERVEKERVKQQERVLKAQEKAQEKAAKELAKAEKKSKKGGAGSDDEGGAGSDDEEEAAEDEGKMAGEIEGEIEGDYKEDVNALINIEGIKDTDAKEREYEELEGDEVLDMFGDVEYKDAITQAYAIIKQNKSQYLSPEKLEIYSPKFLSMLDNIQNPDHRGLNLVYSQFRSMEGIGIFSLVLEANGFAHFKIKKTGIDTWEINISEEDMGKPTYALYTGTEEDDEREILRNIYNGSWDNIPNNIAEQLRARSANNNLGEIIKVLMITSAGSEGINLRNTRYVHIMEPYWHPVRTEQVIGRARRICSHKDLPLELQTVEVFIYIMVFTEKQLNSDGAIELKIKSQDRSKIAPYPVQTSDEKLYELSTIKENLSAQLLTGIKEASIDCATHTKSNIKEGLVCLSFGQPSTKDFSYNPDIFNDQNDTTAAINRVVIDWEAKPFKDKYGKQYMLRVDTNQVYDYESVIQALKVPGFRPELLGKLIKNRDGNFEIIRDRF